MYILVNTHLTMGGLEDPYPIPMVYEVTYKPRFGGYKALVRIFFTKRAAFIEKHRNKLGDGYKVIPLDLFTRMRGSRGVFQLCFYPVRFGFVIGFNESFTITHSYKKIFRKLKDEFCTVGFREKVCKNINIPALNAAILEDSKLSDEEAEKTAKKMIEEVERGKAWGEVII